MGLKPVKETIIVESLDHNGLEGGLLEKVLTLYSEEPISYTAYLRLRPIFKI